jgi:hypothetical protein
MNPNAQDKILWAYYCIHAWDDRGRRGPVPLPGPIDVKGVAIISAYAWSEKTYNTLSVKALHNMRIHRPNSSKISIVFIAVRNDRRKS